VTEPARKVVTELEREVVELTLEERLELALDV